MFRSSKSCSCAVRTSLKDILGIKSQSRASSVNTAKVMNSSKFKLPARYGTGEKSVWVEYNQLIAEIKPAVNLGQGFPDYESTPRHLMDNLAAVCTEGNPGFHQYTRSYEEPQVVGLTCSDSQTVNNTSAAPPTYDVSLHQYTRDYGHVRLVNALAKLYSQQVGREIDPMTEILVSAGAYEALFCAIQGHVEEGDEVIIIEPFFDCYAPMVISAGGTPRYIRLKPTKSGDNVTSADWKLDPAELAGAFNAKTKMIIVNTPHNPLGKVFTADELRAVAELCVRHDAICLFDEVYEWVVYEPSVHVRMASLPGMWERTISVGSAGKTFSVTGWKTGWAYGPARLMANLYPVHQNSVYTHVTPLQEALARSFETELAQLDSDGCYFNSLRRELLPKRDSCVQLLRAGGLSPVVPEGGYFIVADWSGLEGAVDLSAETDRHLDYRFTKHLMKAAGVVAIPPTCFYGAGPASLPAHLQKYARFCFIKKDEVLQHSGELLKKWKNSLAK